MSQQIRRSAKARSVILTCLLAATMVGSSGPNVASAQAVSPAGEFAPAACPFVVPSGIEEGVDVSCGYLTVPERHEAPSGPTIRLAVAVLAPTDSGESGPPLIMLNGGPGQGSDGVLPLFAPGPEGALALLRDGRTVVLVDQRGTGRSEPALLCPGDTVDPIDLEQPVPAATPAVEIPTDIDGQIGFYRECLDGFAQSGVDLGAYTSVQNAADIAALRNALGYDEVDLLGISYGSRLALTVMRDHPEGIRAVVMASVLPLEVDTYAGQVVAFDAALRTVFAGCAADPACAALVPDMESTLVELIARLDATPMPITYQSMLTGEMVDVEVDGATFLYGLYTAMFIGPLVGVIPALIAATDGGSPEVLALLAPITELLNGGIASGMLLAVLCQDEAPFSSMAAIEATAEASDVLPPLQTDEFFQVSGASLQLVCPGLELASSPASENEPVSSDIPTLLISGEFDPITPPAYGELATESLTNATHVVILGTSHDPISTSPECAAPMVEAFLADPGAPVDDACADDLVIDYSPGF
jgi:pimeloyl-ACP methyl ester carboxylesterase